MKRRTFLHLSAAAGTGALLSGCLSARKATRPRQNILILGGTNFLGPALVEHALAQGHDVTLFNRGITRPHLFPHLEKLRGTRHLDGGDLQALAGNRRWDAVIDVWPEHARLVEQTADLLADRADYYYFCSSIAVYTNFSQPNLAETSSIHTNDPGWYGGEKALAEQLVATRFSGRYGVARCHAILGPRDPGVAFHYWLRRLAQHDEVLAPGSGEDPVQYVDVRDVAAWIMDSVENTRVGVYNLCGPSEPLPFRAFLEGCRRAVGSPARLTWVDADFLRTDQGVYSFTDMPLWAPLDEDAGFYQISGAKAVTDGATFRPLDETARDAWQWYQSHFFKDTTFPAMGLGLAREREEEVLAAWRAHG